MYEMERFIQAELLLLVVTVLAVFSGTNPYLCIWLAGMLMIIFTIRSLDEKQSRVLFWIQMFLSLAFAGIAGNSFACLIGYECRISKSKMSQLFTPLVFLSILQLFWQTQSLPEILRDNLVHFLDNLVSGAFGNCGIIVCGRTIDSELSCCEISDYTGNQCNCGERNV